MDADAAAAAAAASAETPWVKLAFSFGSCRR